MIVEVCTLPDLFPESVANHWRRLFRLASIYFAVRSQHSVASGSVARCGPVGGTLEVVPNSDGACKRDVEVDDLKTTWKMKKSRVIDALNRIFTAQANCQVQFLMRL